MIRVLILITVTGFILSVASLAGAFAIGGPDLVSRGGWQWAEGRHWGVDDDDGESRSGPQTSRTLAWSGAEALDVDLAADVRYVQSTGPSSVVISGPQRAVERVVIVGDSLRYEHGRSRHAPKLTIVVTAPNIRAFDLSGRNTLAIEGYRQDRLKIDVSGDAEVTATGEAGEVDLDLSGDGDVNLGALKTKGASVEISGDADATIAPSEWARLDISGSGDVRLLTAPKQLETSISGSGKVTQGAPLVPSAPKAPVPGGAKT